MNVPFVDLGLIHRSMRAELERAFERVLEKGDFILGGALEEFERAFASYVGARFAVGVSSGTDAIRLALEACGVRPGDEVIIPAHTFIATALAVDAVGARAVLADIGPSNYTMDPEDLGGHVTARTRAIVPVHLYGHPADMDPILGVAHEKGIKIVEDAAQAHGAEYKGRRAGSLGDAAAFSFYPAKNLGALGDGGCVTTSDEETYDRLLLLRNYGQRPKNVHRTKGLNMRLDTLQAAFLLEKLKRLDSWNESRRQAAQAYREELAGLDMELPGEAPWAEHVYHLYVVRCRRRDEFLKHMASRGIGCGVHYPTPIHLHECFAGLGYRAGDFPSAEEATAQVVSLPMFAGIAPEQVAEVAGAAREYFGT